MVSSLDELDELDELLSTLDPHEPFPADAGGPPVDLDFLLVRDRPEVEARINRSRAGRGQQSRLIDQNADRPRRADGA